MIFISRAHGMFNVVSGCAVRGHFVRRDSEHWFEYCICVLVNSLWPGAEIWRHKTLFSVDGVVVCYPITPSHCLDQPSIKSKKDKFQCIFSADFLDIDHRWTCVNVFFFTNFAHTSKELIPITHLCAAYYICSIMRKAVQVFVIALAQHWAGWKPRVARQ